MKAKDLMKEVKNLSIKEFIKFEKQFYAYVKEVSEELSAPVKTKEASIEKSIPKANVTVVTKQVIETQSDKPTDKSVKTEWKISDSSSWKDYFEAVKETGLEMGSETDKTGIITAVKKNDNIGSIAALVGHRGKAVNMVWGTCYELPILFDKCSKEDLETYKNQIIENIPEGANINEHGANGKFYYDELEQGNFICQFVDEDAKIKRLGYIVDQGVCFFINDDGSIVANDIKYYFVKHWGKRPEAEEDIKALLERANFEEIEIKEDNESFVSNDTWGSEWGSASFDYKKSSIVEDAKENATEQFQKQDIWNIASSYIVTDEGEDDENSECFEL